MLVFNTCIQHGFVGFAIRNYDLVRLKFNEIIFEQISITHAPNEAECLISIRKYSSSENYDLNQYNKPLNFLAEQF